MQLCVALRGIFPHQPNLLEIKAPINGGDGHGGGDDGAILSISSVDESPFRVGGFGFLHSPIPQALHHTTCMYKENRWNYKRLAGSGGMPSSHSATGVALAVAIGLQEGTGGSLLALATILASVKYRKSQEPAAVDKLKEPILDEVTSALVKRYHLNFTRQDIAPSGSSANRKHLCYKLLT